MNSDSERMNGQLPEKDSGECAEKACENADDRDFGSEFVSDEILCGETEDDCRNGGKIVIAAQKNGGRLDAFAAEHTELTRSAVQRLLLCEAVTVNGRSEKQSMPCAGVILSKFSFRRPCRRSLFRRIFR